LFLKNKLMLNGVENFNCSYFRPAYFVNVNTTMFGQVLLNHLCAGLVSCHPVVSGTSHALLVRCLPSVMQQLNSTAAPKMSEKEGALTEELAVPNVLIRLIVQVMIMTCHTNVKMT
jgi:hypothetical protein